MIAQTILNQLGGNKMIAMTGAKNLCDTGNGLSFRIRGSKKVNYIKITLNSMDLYDIEFGKIQGVDYKVVSEVSGYYADMIKKEIEQTTGLYLSM